MSSITTGFGNRKISKRHIPYNAAPVENVFSSADAKAQIVLGGDRNSDTTSGYSGLGSEDSSAIDIVCGRGKTLSEEVKEKASFVNPDFFNDAARIYISEKADIDEYFKITSGKNSGVGKSVASSAIAMKADAIRIIGVEGIKLVTRANPTNSKGFESGVKGIELVAGNDDTFLQPMVKGDNLVKCIDQILTSMSHLESQIHNIYSFLDKFTTNYASHVHPSAAPGPPTPSPTAFITSVAFNAENIAHSLENQEMEDKLSKIRIDFLNIPSHDKNILSKYNKTN